jgi:Calcineurin-like phosphoesterase
MLFRRFRSGLVLLCICIAVVQLCLGDQTLPFGDVNIIVVTDVHSFIGGHQHEADRDADYGDVLSFYQHVKNYCDEQGSDLFFFNVGDWIHGTGLAMDGNATMLVPLLKQMPWDGITMGNHEAYFSSVVELMKHDMVPHFGEAFITSNVDYTQTMDTFGGSRFRLIHGTHSTVLTFGFVYDTHNPSRLVHVKKVEDVLKEDWFRVALREHNYDAIVVLAHMDNDDRRVDVILHAIREHVDACMPVQFLTGHTHQRKVREIQRDHFSRAFEAGGNLDTVGFVSMPTFETASSAQSDEVKALFKGEFLNASKVILKERAGVDSLPTKDGAALSEKISQTRSELGLDEVVGCPPREYFLNRSIHENDSLLKLWIEHVAPSQICARQGDCAVLISSDSFRYDMRIGMRNEAVTVDDIVAIAPYMEPVMYVGELPEWLIRRMNSSLNTDALNHHHMLPDYLLAGKFEHDGDKNRLYKFYTHEFNLPAVMHDIDRLLYNEHELKPQKTELKDTLYWLSYAQAAWQCPQHKEQNVVRPWFADIKELGEKASDGGPTSESMDELDEELDGELNILSDEDKGIHFFYEGYEGYLPPSTIEHYKDKLPPGTTASNPLKPKVPEMPKAPLPKPAQKNLKHSAAALKAERMTRRKKAKKRAFRVVGALVAIGLLSIPLCGLYRVFFPDKQQRNAMSDEQFYDMKDMRAFRKQRNQRPVLEIQLT